MLCRHPHHPAPEIFNIPCLDNRYFFYFNYTMKILNLCPTFWIALACQIFWWHNRRRHRYRKGKRPFTVSQNASTNLSLSLKKKAGVIILLIFMVWELEVVNFKVRMIAYVSLCLILVPPTLFNSGGRALVIGVIPPRPPATEPEWIKRPREWGDFSPSK